MAGAEGGSKTQENYKSKEVERIFTVWKILHCGLPVGIQNVFLIPILNALLAIQWTFPVNLYVV